MRLHDYLRRVGVAPGLPPTADTLRRLHLAHREAFLFDNVAIQAGGTISVALDAIERKFIDEGRGGYCFEHNTLFASVLRDLGLPVTLLGRVRRGPPERWARTHMVLKVPADGESGWRTSGLAGRTAGADRAPRRHCRGAGRAYLCVAARRVGYGSFRCAIRRRPSRPARHHRVDDRPLRIQRRSADRRRRRSGEPLHVNASRLGVPPDAHDPAIGARRPRHPARRHADPLHDGRTIEEPIARERLRDVARELFGVELPAGPLISDTEQQT